MIQMYRRKIEIYGPLSWPREISLEEFLAVNQRFMDLVTSTSKEKIQPEIKAHVRGTELQNLEDLTKYAKTNPTFEGADIHFHTESISCAICTRKRGSETRESALLWASGIALGTGLLETYHGQDFGTAIGILTTVVGLVGSTYGWKEQRRGAVKYLELTVMKRTHNSATVFKDVGAGLAGLKV